MMHTIIRRLVLCSVLMLMSAYLASSATAPHQAAALMSPDLDALALIQLSEQAQQRASEVFPDVILLQVYTDLTQTSFRFMDRTATTEIQVRVPASTAPLDQWPVHSHPLVIGGSGIDVRHLTIGPKRADIAMLAGWPGCTRSGLGLYLFGTNGQLVWDISCSTAEGVVKGKMDDQTGVFQRTDGPALPPPTAMP